MIVSRIRNLIRGVQQRWAPAFMKRKVWDTEYASGKWDHCDNTADSFIYAAVQKYAKGGAILDLGCGSGNTGLELDPRTYSSYLGVDVSEVAIRKAEQRSKEAGRKVNCYLAGDVITFSPPGKYDVILFRESIYYIPEGKMVSVLERYATHLARDGVFIVHVSTRGTRHACRIREILENAFTIIECVDPNRDDFLLVFRTRSSF